MWTEEAFQLTSSDLSWVTAMDWGKVYRFLRGYTLILLMISILFLHSTPAVLCTVRLQIVASLVPWNSKAVGSAPDRTATFPEMSLVRLLAVVVGDWC